MQWMILLEGDESHLSALSNQLSSSECNVVEEDGRYYLYSSRFNSLTSHDEQLDSYADEIIQSIDGGGLIRIAAICKEDKNGKRSCNYRFSCDINIDTSTATLEGLVVRSPLSFSHIKAAAHLAKLSYEIEAAYDGKHPSDLFYEHRAYVTGSIITAVSYLEATINELFSDVADGLGLYCEQINSDVAALMANMWRVEVKPPNGKKSEKVYSPLDDLKPSILQKFQIALTLAQKELFDTGKTPYQDVDALIDLRNALIHYKPEWIGDGEGYEKTLCEKLRKKLERRIKRLNILTAGGSCAFFPHKCLGYGGAKWAVESCVTFTDEFFAKMGLQSNLNEDFRSSLNLPEIS